MMTARLDFDPGSKMAYSNLGYVMLGRIIEKISGERYESFVRKNILEPCGIRRSIVSEHRRGYQRGEARCYLAGSTAPFGPMDLTTVVAAGGWSLSAVDLVRILSKLDGSRGKPYFGKKTFEQMIALPPPPLKRQANGSHNGLGWPTVYVKGDLYAYFHDGMMHGMRTFMKRNGNGVNWALLFNLSMQPDEADANLLKQAVQEVHKHIEGLDKLPDVDLFKDFD
jgi:N-acyl-D-amino-acid deacylase